MTSQSFGQFYAHRLRHRRPSRGNPAHLDDVFICVGGEQHHLCRVFDQDG